MLRLYLLRVKAHYLNIVHVRHVVISLFSLAHFSMGVALCYLVVCTSSSLYDFTFMIQVFQILGYL